MKRKQTQTNFMKSSKGSELWSRLRKSPLAMISLAFLILILLVAIFADVIAPYTTQALTQHPELKLAAPSAQHIFGCDQFGRDLFARVIHGTRTALLMGIGATAISVVMGMILASLAAYFGGKVDMVIMRIVDLLSCMPPMVMSLAICAGLGSGLWQLVVALSVAGLPIHTRMIRSYTLGVVKMEYMDASRAMGGGTWHAIGSHVTPNIMSIFIIQGTTSISTNIMQGATLSYIGLGVQAPRPEWGLMISDGLDYMLRHPHMLWAPGLALVFAVLVVNTLGDCLRDANDPHLKGKA